MATGMPHVFHPLIPVTPPPEQQTFRKPALPLSSHLKRKAPSDAHPPPLNNSTILPPIIPPLHPPTSTPSLGHTLQSQTTVKDEKPGANGTATGANQSLDPRYVAMVSRIAAYYQQRCQAISNAQQQRCQAWANMHRQKCQDTMQAAMLVVAWYIRDRIQRRRRKQKRAFRSGLRKQNAAKSRVTKGETVRRWVMKVPEDAVSPYLPGLEDLIDEEEATFSMDSEPPPPDKDTKLFETADQLIKSQYRKIEVPMLGILSFDESDSESESDADDLMQDDLDRFPQHWGPTAGEEEMAEDDVEEGDYDDDEDYEEDVLEDDDQLRNTDTKECSKAQAHGSDQAQQGTNTGTGSRINNRSQSS